MICLHCGKRSSVSDAARAAGLKVATVYRRIDNGWSLEEATTTPTLGNGRRVKRERVTPSKAYRCGWCFEKGHRVTTCPVMPAGAER